MNVIEMLNKVLTCFKDIIVDWKIGIISFVGFLTGFIVTKDVYLIIGIVVSLSIVIVDVICKNSSKWRERFMINRLQKKLSDQKYQQQFFDNCSSDEINILLDLYDVYPSNYLLPMNSVVVKSLESKLAIVRMSNLAEPDFDCNGNWTVMSVFTLQPWVKMWLDNNRDTLKKN